MQCTCKQCGKSFELTTDEIKFYESKNLSLPKRCKSCREINKKQKGNKKTNNNPLSGNTVSAKPSTYNYGKPSASEKAVRRKKIIAAVVFAIMIIAYIYLTYSGGIGNNTSDTANNNMVSENADTLNNSLVSENADTLNNSLVSENDDTLNNSLISENVSTSNEETSSVNSDFGAETVNDTLSESDLIPDVDEVITVATDEEDNSVTENSINEDKPESVANDKETTINQVKGFRNKTRLEEHFEKHGIEMGFSSAKEYEQAAKNVVNNANSLHKTEAEDGDDVYYLEATNEFVVVATDGYIRTYYKPRGGIDYFNRQ